MPNLTTPKKQKNNTKRNLLIGGSLLGGGAAAYGLSNAVLNQNEIADLTQFQNTARNEWMVGKDPRAALRDYAYFGHKATNTKPFGLGVVDVMKTLRHPKIMNHPLVQRRMPNAPNFAWNPKSGDHYLGFQKSPLDGYLTLNRELAQGQSPVVENTLKKMKEELTGTWLPGRPGDGRINNFLDRSGALADSVKNAPGGRERVIGSLRDLMRDTQSGWANPLFGRSNPGAYDKNYYNKLVFNAHQLAKDSGIDYATANATQKGDLYNRLDEYIKQKDPGLWKQKQMGDWALGRETHFAGGTYSNIITPFVGASNLLKYTGLAAGAAGAGIGGYALYKMLKSHLAKKKTKNSVQVMPPVIPQQAPV